MGTGIVKSRPLGHLSGKNEVLYYISGVLATDSSVNYDFWGYQETYSKSHPELFQYRRGAKVAESLYRKFNDPSILKSWNILRHADVGGPFYTRRQAVTIGSPQMVGGGGLKPIGIKSYTCNTQFFVVSSNVTKTSLLWPSVISLSAEQDALIAKGTDAIARTAPTVPVFSLANFVGELRNDGLPSLIGSVAYRVRTLPQLLKAGGNEYLNVEFAWKPLLSDIFDICKAVRKSKQLIEQYEERSGRNIARTYDYPVERTTSVVDDIARIPAPALDLNAYVGGSPSRMVTKSIETSRHYWFEGVYQYNLPTPSEAREKIMLYASEAEKLLGLRVTPEVLWNLAPWSWFSDWFLNIGSIMTNVSAFSKDNLLLTRGYVMCTSYAKHTYTHPGITLAFGSTGTLSQSFETQTKTRVRATPWGFGLTFTAFTPRQIAIMAALGLTREWQVGTWK